jgi:hypothetical protein
VVGEVLGKLEYVTARASMGFGSWRPRGREMTTGPALGCLAGARRGVAGCEPAQLTGETSSAGAGAGESVSMKGSGRVAVIMYS